MKPERPGGPQPQLYGRWPSGQAGRPFDARPMVLALAFCTVAAHTSGQPPGADALPQRELSSPTELLALYGIDAAQLAALAEGDAWDEPQLQTLIRILYRLPQFPLNWLETWAAGGADAEALAAAPQDYRGQATHVRGRVLQVDSLAVPSDVAQGVGFAEYYRVRLDIGPGPEAIVYTRAVPAPWRAADPQGEPAAATALFLMTGQGGDPAPLVLAAPRVAWFPDRPRPALGVAQTHVYLAQLGMDVGLLDHLRDRHRKPIEHRERECFYQLLAAVRRADAADFARRAAAAFQLAPLLLEPQRQHGRLMTVRGTARRILRLPVGDPDIQQRFGIDHYFQIDLFVPLGNVEVKLERPDGEDGPTFVNSYPVTVCTAELPPGLSPGEDLRERVEIPAVFFKLWSYHSRYVAPFDERQISPMVIGRQVTVVEDETAASPYAGLAVAAVFLVALAAIWYGVWRYNREDAAFTRDTLRRRYRLRDERSLDRLPKDLEEEPKRET